MALSLLDTGVMFAIAGAIFLSASAIFIRIGTEEGNVLHALAVALGINILILALGSAVWFYPTYHLTPISVAVFVGAGLSSTVVGRSLYFISIDRIGASRTEPIKASQPLHATIVAVIVLGEVVSGLHGLGIVLIVVGVAIISWESNRHRHDRITASWHALALPLAAAFLFGVEPTFIKIGFAEGTPVFVGLAVKTIAAGVGFYVYLRWKNVTPGLADLRSASGRWYVAAGLANTGFLTSYFLALESTPVVVVVPLIQSSPLLILVASYLFLNRLERVTPKLAAGAIVTVAGAITVTVFG